MAIAALVISVINSLIIWALIGDVIILQQKQKEIIK